MVQPQTQRARALRKNATKAERILWRGLRAMPLAVRVRRQHPIGSFIADFAVPSRKLVIEVDGGQHATTVARDDARTRVLQAKGWRVIRFWNNDVMRNLDGVLQVIVAEIERAPSALQGSREGASARSTASPLRPSGGRGTGGGGCVSSARRSRR